MYWLHPNLPMAWQTTSNPPCPAVSDCHRYRRHGDRENGHVVLWYPHHWWNALMFAGLGQYHGDWLWIEAQDFLFIPLTEIHLSRACYSLNFQVHWGFIVLILDTFSPSDICCMFYDLHKAVCLFHSGNLITVTYIDWSRFKSTHSQSSVMKTG